MAHAGHTSEHHLQATLICFARCRAQVTAKLFKRKKRRPILLQHEKKWREAFNAGNSTAPPGDPLRPAVCCTILRHSVHDCRAHHTWMSALWQFDAMLLKLASIFPPLAEAAAKGRGTYSPKNYLPQGCRLGYWHWKDVSSMVGWQRCHGFLKYLGVKDGRSEARSIKNMDRHASNLQET